MKMVEDITTNDMVRLSARRYSLGFILLSLLEIIVTKNETRIPVIETDQQQLLKKK